MKKISTFLISAALVSGCAAPYNTNFPLVEKGMSTQKITELLGKPESADAGHGNDKILYYRLASSILDTDGSDTREYWVLVRDGSVINYGERNDASVVRRQQLQFQGSHNAARSLNDLNKTLIESTAKPQPVTPRPSGITNCTSIGSSTTCSSY